MEHTLQLVKKIAPDLTEEMVKRYRVLKTVRLLQPCGRRLVVLSLGMTERTVRSEIERLSAQNLVHVSKIGMSLTEAKDKLKELGFTKEPVVKYIAGKEAKDTVVTQLPKEELEYELGVEITLEVSDGSLVPKTITKNVRIDLKGYADEDRCLVSVQRDGEVLLELSVPQGTPSVELLNQEGAGTVYYTVMAGDGETWVHTEEFVEEAPPTEATQEAVAPNG